jgi:hypothetical protein
MRYFQRKMIGFAAVMAFILVYAPLRQFPFGVDAAICASFTVLVFGNAIRRRGFACFPATTQSRSPKFCSPTPPAWSPSSSSSGWACTSRRSCPTG